MRFNYSLEEMTEKEVKSELFGEKLCFQVHLTTGDFKHLFFKQVTFL